MDNDIEGLLVESLGTQCPVEALGNVIHCDFVVECDIVANEDVLLYVVAETLQDGLPVIEGLGLGGIAMQENKWCR